MDQKTQSITGWEDCLLSDVLSLKNGYAFKSSEYQKLGVPIIRISDIQDGVVTNKSAKCIYENTEFDNYSVENGDILIAMSGATTGKFGVYTSDAKAYQNQRVGNFRLHSSNNIDKKFIYYILHSLKREIEKGAYGGAQPNISSGKIESLNFTLPPLNEQHRIVEKIEELFSELDKGIESLKTAQEQLKAYRQALLKHAFEGKLTEQWRKDNVDKLETADQLLSRIQQEREIRYQQQLNAWSKAVKKWEADGKERKKPARPKVIKKISIDEKEMRAFPVLNTNWVYCPLGNLIDDPKYGTSKKCSYDLGKIGVLRIPNIVSGCVDSRDLKLADFNKHELYDYRLIDGDVLIIRSNGSISIVGKSALIENKDTSFIYAGYLIRLRVNFKVLHPKFLLYLLQSHQLRKQIEFKAKSTSGVNNINSGELQSLIMPIMGIEEQEIIVRNLEEKLSIVSNMQTEVENNLKHSEALRQSILKKAFSGQLVPQDPTDEPASILLERIAAEKAAVAAKAKKAKKPKKRIITRKAG